MLLPQDELCPHPDPTLQGVATGWGWALVEGITPRGEIPVPILGSVLGAVTTGHIYHCCRCQWDGTQFPLVRWASGNLGKPGKPMSQLGGQGRTGCKKSQTPHTAGFQLLTVHLKCCTCISQLGKLRLGRGNLSQAGLSKVPPASPWASGDLGVSIPVIYQQRSGM